MDDPLNQANEFRFGKYLHQEGAPKMFTQPKEATFTKPREAAVIPHTAPKNVDFDLKKHGGMILGAVAFAVIGYIAVDMLF